MGKYDRLGAFLAAHAGAEVPLSFQQIESLIGAPLPPAASRHRAWWSNNATNSVITRAWRNAGFRAFQVDMTAGSLVFRRDGDPAEPSVPVAPRRATQAAILERLWLRLGGTVSLPHGMDLAEPTGEVWDAEIQ